MDLFFLIVGYGIRDTGVGIQENTKKYLFDAFFQGEVGKNHNEGVGLGLSIASQLIKKMDGHIDVTSKLGLRCIFRFTVNLKKDDEFRTKTTQHFFEGKTTIDSLLASMQNRKNGYSSSQRNNIRRKISSNADSIHNESTNKARILLVEDNDINRLATTHMLKSFGHFLISAGNGSDVLEILSNVQFDLILMDCQMPNIDGLETTRKLRAHEQEIKRLPIPIIAVTASEDLCNKKLCLDAGMNDVVTKSSSKKKLQRLVNFLELFRFCHRHGKSR